MANVTIRESNQSGYSGIAAAAKFNPHLWSPDELRAIFVARKRELADILQSLSGSLQGAPPQHLLITGQRGMGKSTLLQRTALAVEEDPVLSQTWLPLRFPEEQYTVSTPAELWANVIGALADALERQDLPTLEIDAELARITNLPTNVAEDAALSWLAQWCQTHQRRLLLLIDSTDLLFSNLANGDSNKRDRSGGASALWRVRKTLTHAPHFFWLGGSYQPLETNGLYSDAFLDFFQLIELRPLTLEEMQNAILAMADVFGAGRGLKGAPAAAEVSRMLSARPERLRAMRQLTGGNPRTTVMLYELFAAGGKDSLRADLERLLDAMTPLYKARLEVLADQPRKVLAHVFEHWAPIAANALAKNAGMPVSSVSTQLSRLEQEGLIEKTELSGTKRWGFQSAERFFNIWYLMRNASRGARARVGWLVEFMRLWYSNSELQDLARYRWDGHRSGKLCDRTDLEYSRAIAHAMPDQAQDRLKLDYEVFHQARKSPDFDELFELAGSDQSYAGPQDYLRRFEALQQRLMEAPLPEGERTAWTKRVKSALSLELAQKEYLAVQCHKISRKRLAQISAEIIEMESDAGSTNPDQGYEQVASAVERGEFFPECPNSRIAYTQILSCFESMPGAFLIALDYMLSHCLDGYAQLACKKAIDIAPYSAMPWAGLGVSLKGENKWQEAEAAFRNGIAVDPTYLKNWNYLGDLLMHQLDRYDDAEIVYRGMIEFNPTQAWMSLGQLFERHTKQFEAAEDCYRKAIASKPRFGLPWNVLGDLLQSQQNRLGEAEKAYRSAIKLEPKWPQATLDLAGLLITQNRVDEAEATYREGIQRNPASLQLKLGLGHLLSDVRKRFEEAEIVFREATALNKEEACPVLNLARTQAKLGRSEEATISYRRAVELSDDTDQNLRLQAHLWLGNEDLALQALNALAEKASKGKLSAFSKITEQCFECNAIGLAAKLVALMQRSRFADFLLAFSIALRAANGDADAMLDVAVEVRGVAEEVLKKINRSA
jgi:tetratricopeptide (TPR) repeat protein